MLSYYVPSPDSNLLRRKARTPLVRPGFLYGFLLSRLGDLPAGVVDGEVGPALAGQDEPAHRDHFVAVFLQPVQDGRQGLGGVEGGVVEEDDGAGGYPVGDTLRDGGRVVVLPVQAVPTGSGCKGLGEKGFPKRKPSPRRPCVQGHFVVYCTKTVLFLRKEGWQNEASGQCDRPGL